MAGRGTDILLGGNAEYMARQQTLAEQVAERLPKGQEKFVDDEEFVYFFHLDSFYRVSRKDYERIYAELKIQTDAEHEELVRLGGLHIIGTERHESRRIDNQLRQCRPSGRSRILTVLPVARRRSDAHLRIGPHCRPDDALGMEEGVPIEHGMVSKAIERAQKQVEAQNFATRKHLLEYDDVTRISSARRYSRPS
jgi:preprotein translocase subunit SecA